VTTTRSEGEALSDRKDYERKRLLVELERSEGNMARAGR
jgi:hypothetical protein